MRRGLIAWSRAELPEVTLDARVARVQAAMVSAEPSSARTAKLDALVVYTIPARTAGVSWLTGFVPYWNEGLVVVPRQGRPVLVSALSNRVKDWIERNAHVERVVSNPKIGVEAAGIIAGHKAKAVVGVVDLPRLPASLIEALVAGGHDVRDGSAVFSAARAAADPAEQMLATMAATIAQRAFECADTANEGNQDAGRLIGLMEGEARRLGAEEVYPAVAADLARRRNLVRLEGAVQLGASHAVRLSVAYKGVWVRLTQTFARDAKAQAAFAAAELTFSTAVAGLPDTSALAKAQSWLIEGCRTSTPLEPLAGSNIADGVAVRPGEIVNVQATFEIDGHAVLIGAPVLLGRAREPASRLVPPLLVA